MKSLFTKRPPAESPAPAETVSDAIVSAKSKVERLAAMELKHFECWRGLGVEIEEERASIGLNIVEAELNGLPAPDGVRLGRLRAERENAALAGAAAREKRPAAIRAYFGAQARDLRAKAEKLREEITVRKVKTDRLLAELKDHEGAEYIPLGRLLLVQLQSGVYFADGTTERVRREGVPDWPRTETLAAQADALERQADELSRRAVPDSGAASAASVDALLAAVLADPLTLGPGLQSIAGWAEGVEQDVRLANPRAGAVRFVLSWRGGQVNVERSNVVEIGQP